MNDFSRRILGLSQKQLVLLATQLQSRLDDIETSAREPVAVLGIGLRFPGGANDPASFWRLLRDRVDAVAEVPKVRWDVDAWYDPDVHAPGKISTRWAGLIDAVDRFDAPFFGIAPREALTMDPQQRLLLEVAWEALERAGLPPERLAGTRTGVFIGISGNDYSHLQLSEGTSHIDAYFASGNAHSVASGRLSYTLGLQGPSLSVDTACSSSLVAVHLAVQSLRSRECGAALAGGVNLILSPEITIALSKAGMMAPGGRCKAFDARADGFVRGEGCAVLVLKRLSDAVREKDPILAVIRGSAINQDGKSNGLTAPNGPSQEEVIRRAIESAGLRPDDVGYVEAHGTGTSLGDPIEASALANIFGGRTGGNRLWVGSVKTNIGHLESAAGIAGLVKIILSLRHGEIPPHLHFEAPNPLIDWENAPFRIPTDPVAWAPGEKPRVAGVSSFGFSGTNAHVVIEEAPAGLAEDAAEADRPLHLLTLSAPDGEGLVRLAERYAEALSTEEGPLPDICFTANAGRSHFKHRLAIVSDSAERARSSLIGSMRGEASGAARTGAARTGAARKRNSSEIAFLFTGQGSQYAGMGKELYRSHPAFRETIDRCGAILEPMIGRTPASILFPEDGGSAIDRTEFAQPALFALEYALAALWKSWGFEPAWVMGHSVGEYAAACAAGLFSLEDGLRIVAERGRLMQSLPEGGAMAAVFADPLLVESAISESPGTVSIAAFNGSENTVISGAASKILALLARFEKHGIRSRRLTVSHAFHSALIDPMLDPFEAAFRGVSFGRLTAGFVSNVTGRHAEYDILSDPGYWRRHTRGPVRFADSIDALFREGCRTFIEIGPDPVLIGMGGRILPPGETLNVPSLRRGKRDWASMLDALSTLYVNGFSVDWSGFDGAWPRRKRVLPTYPFEKRRYWSASERKPEPDRVRPWIHWLYEYGWEPKPAGGKLSAAAHASPGVIARDVLADIESLFSRHGVSIYDSFLPLLGRLCSAYILKALRGLGWAPRPGERFTASGLADRLGIVPLHLPLFARMLSILAEDGVVHREEGGAYVLETALPAQDPDALLLRLRAEFPACAAELDMIGRSAGSAAEILRGTCDPMALLFPDGSLALTEKMYREAPVLRFFNALMERLVSGAVNRSRGGRLRILEIGAGTGGTTSYLLPALPAERTDYFFTDVSEVFLSGARRKFADFNFLEYRLLDIDADPEGQGYAAGSFDIVVAANVLHATPDLRKSVSHIQKLLAPGGLLLLLEGTAPQRFSDLTVGFTKGWWQFADRSLRPDYPLIPTDAWDRLLEEHGFEETRMLPGPIGDAYPVLREQTVIVSRKPADSRLGSDVRNRPPWLVFADEKGGGGSLAGEAELNGVACILAFKGETFTQHCGTSFSLDPLNPADYRRLLETILSTEGRPPERIVHLWGLDETPAGEPSGRDANQHQTCGSVLYLVQAISAVYCERPPQLVLITRGAQAVKPGDSLDGIDQASLWGLGRVIAREHPELKPVRIDIDGIDMAAPAAELLAGSPDEAQIAWRGGERFVLRLKRHAADDRGLSAPRFRDDASYLVTGGLGGLGIETARRMVEHGARRLYLVGRKPPSPGIEKIIGEMEAEGAEIVVLQQDVAEPGALESVFARIASGRKPLRGVIHAAGALDDGILLQQSWERFRKVMRAKIDGSWRLHTLTRSLDLDFFVLFSSGASFLGSAGQGNHAAANAFMDALAWRRRAERLPATAINWGAWSETGAATRENVVRRIETKGMAPIGTREGLEALEYLIASGATQVGVLPIDWKIFLNGAGESSETKIFERFSDPERSSAGIMRPEKPAGLSETLEKTSPGKRYDLLLDAVRKEVVRCLRLEPGYPLDIDRPLSEMGLDSLMAVELRNALNTMLGASLPATLLFNYPSIRELAGHLMATALPEGPPKMEEEAVPTEDPDLDGITETEIEQLLEEELRRV